MMGYSIAGIAETNGGEEMIKPLCFVLMLFGRKPDETGRLIDSMRSMKR